MHHNHVGLIKHFAACLYEFLSLVAIWLLCTAMFVFIFENIDTEFKRLCLQLLLWLVTGAYFVSCWVRTGQTLAAQAWKIKLVNMQKQPLSVSQAMLRYGLVTISLACFCLGFLWALIDKDRLFLHDRLLKTQFIKASD